MSKGTEITTKRQNISNLVQMTLRGFVIFYANLQNGIATGFFFSNESSLRKCRYKLVRFRDFVRFPDDKHPQMYYQRIFCLNRTCQM